MERFLDVEMAVISVHNQLSETDKNKYKIFRTILDNDFNSIPENFTAVFLRGTPVQIVPDDCIREIKLMSLRGFFHENNESRFVCFCDANSKEGQRLFRDIMECVVKWMSVRL